MIWRHRRANALAGGGILLLALASPAATAASGRVILLQSHAASAGAHRCLTLIHDELTAGGFEVATVDAGPHSDPISTAEVMRRQQGAVASIALLGDPETGTAELWILDRIGGAAEVRRIPATTDDPERVAEVLAIRTMELLRASALKWLVESSREITPSSPTAVPAPSPPPLTTKINAVGIETGLSVLYNVGGVGAAVLPLARLRVRAADAIFLRLSLAGLGSRPRVTSVLGSAVVQEDLGIVEVGATFRRGSRVRPLITVGAGAFHVSIEGQGISPYLGARDGRWASMFDCAVGAYLTLGAAVGIAVELHAFLAAPPSYIRFGEITSETLGRPAVWATVTLVAWP